MLPGAEYSASLCGRWAADRESARLEILPADIEKYKLIREDIEHPEELRYDIHGKAGEVFYLRSAHFGNKRT